MIFGSGQNGQPQSLGDQPGILNGWAPYAGATQNFNWQPGGGLSQAFTTHLGGSFGSGSPGGGGGNSSSLSNNPLFRTLSSAGLLSSSPNDPWNELISGYGAAAGRNQNLGYTTGMLGAGVNSANINAVTPLLSTLTNGASGAQNAAGLNTNFGMSIDPYAALTGSPTSVPGMSQNVPGLSMI